MLDKKPSRGWRKEVWIVASDLCDWGQVLPDDQRYSPVCLMDAEIAEVPFMASACGLPCWAL
ncbi:MAG: hypothetical protein FD135_3339, partial [Comamonadaceae bacterium]